MKKSIIVLAAVLLMLASFAPARAVAADSAVAASSCGDTVVVVRGDTLSAIARRCGTTVAAILQANPSVRNPNQIYPNMRLTMPGGSHPAEPTSYVVKRGDTLSAIARRFGTTVSALMAANPRVTNANRIYVGQRLVIPAGGSSGGVVSSVRIYLVALEQGNVGCGDGLVGAVRAVQPTGAPLTAALNQLLAIKTPYYGQSGLYNALHQSDLTVGRIARSGNAWQVWLNGTLVLGGVCDAPRIEAQLERTALQFAEVGTVQFYVNGVLLETALSGR